LVYDGEELAAGELDSTIPGSYAELIENRKNKFLNEFNKHFNWEYTMVYYIMTELFL
jgi:hypothetical protein